MGGKNKQADSESRTGRRVFSLQGLGPGDHVCCIYRTEAEHRAVLAPFLKYGLERNEKVFYIVDAHTAAQVIDYMRKEGVDIGKYVKKGQFSVLRVSDAYMKEGVFDPNKMIALLKSETAKALKEGYSALRVTGEMSWALKGLPGSERLFEYEAMLNDFFPGSRALAICQYDARKFSPEVLLNVIDTHPIAGIGTTFYDNFYFMPAKVMHSKGVFAARLRGSIENLEARRKSDEVLRESEERYRSLFETANVMVQSVGPDGRYKLVNREWTKTLGYGKSDLKTLTFLDVIRKDYRKHCIDAFKQIASGKSLYGIDVVFVAKNGREIYANGNIQPVMQDGKFISTIGFFMDITARKKAEEKLKLKDLFFEFSLTANSTADVKGNLNSVNEAFLKAWGYRRKEEVLGKSIAAFLKSKEKVAEIVGALQKTGKWSGEYVAVRKDGSEFIAEGFATTLVDKHGTLVGFQSAVLDITKRKKAEEALAASSEELKATNEEMEATNEELKATSEELNATNEELKATNEEMEATNEELKATGEDLRASEEKFRTVVENVNDAILTYDSTGRILDVNDNACKLLGYKRTELVGSTLERINSKENRPAVRKRLSELFKKGKLLWETTDVRKDGSPIPVYVSAKVISRSGKGIAQSFVRDITELKKAEIELAESKRLLTESEQIGNVGGWELNVDTGKQKWTEEVYRIHEVDPSFNPNLTKGVDFYTPASKPIIEQAVQQAIKHGKPFDVELEITTAKGNVRSVHAIGKADLKHRRVYGFFQDITELKKAEIELALNSQRMQALLKLNQMTGATLKEITDFALEEAVRLTQSTIGYLAFLNEDESVLTMHSWSKSAMKECAIIKKPIIYPVVSTGLWGEAVRQRKPVITNDYGAANPLKKGIPKGHVPLKRHMNLPVFDGSRIVIVAGVGNKTGEYNQSDVQQLTLLMEGMWRLLERKKAEQAVKDYSANLEGEVAKRTEELEKRNRQLEEFREFAITREKELQELRLKLKKVEEKANGI